MLPVNVLARPGGPSVAELGGARGQPDLGRRRVRVRRAGDARRGRDRAARARERTDIGSEPEPGSAGGALGVHRSGLSGDGRSPSSWCVHGRPGPAIQAALIGGASITAASPSMSAASLSRAGARSARPKNREDDRRDERSADERCRRRGAHPAVGGRHARDRHDQRQGGRAVARERETIAHRQRSPVEQERRNAAHDEEQQEEHRQFQQRGWTSDQRVQVELDPADDEEERNQQAEADRGQLRLEHRHLAAAHGHPGDHAGDEAAEHDVESELRGECGKAEHEQCRQPHCELAAGLDRPLDLRPTGWARSGLTAARSQSRAR